MPTTTMPSDALAAVHHRTVQEFSTRIITASIDATEGAARIQRVSEALPDAIEAAKDNPLGEEGVLQLVSLSDQLLSHARMLSTVARNMARQRLIGLDALRQHERRLAELRLDGLVLTDDEDLDG